MASFNDMPVTGKIGAVIAVALVLTAGLYFGLYKAIADQNETDAKSLAGKEAEIAQLQPYQNKLADLNRSVDALKQQLELQKRIVPDEKEVEGFIKMMQTEAQKSNVEIRRYTANPIVNKEFYSEAPFAMDIDGPYFSVLDFFQRVAKMERIININNLAMASVSKPTGAKVKKSYKYEPNETVVVSCVATAFFSRENTAAPPPPKKRGQIGDGHEADYECSDIGDYGYRARTGSGEQNAVLLPPAGQPAAARQPAAQSGAGSREAGDRARRRSIPLRQPLRQSRRPLRRSR